MAHRALPEHRRLSGATAFLALLLSAGPAGGASPTGAYRHWPEYAAHPSARPQLWRDADDVIDGWDFSLPPHVRPSSGAMIRWGMNGWKGALAKARFPEGMTVVDEIWWPWKYLEPREGEYDFARLREEVRQRLDAGCHGVLIRLLVSVWTKGTDADVSKAKEPQLKTWSAPRWLAKHDIPKVKFSQKDGSGLVTCLDMSHPAFQAAYLRMVGAFGASGLPGDPALRGVLICGGSRSNGEEGTGYTAGDAEGRRRYEQRIEAWAKAFGRHRGKLITMDADEFPRKLALGSRDGFVEMYLIHMHSPVRGTFVDADRYLCVDESNPYLSGLAVFGDENEEYRPSWTERFGPLESFPYRYFTSMLRMLQMRRNYLYTETQAVYPELLWYVCHGLGRNVADAPDAWCWLRESYLSRWANGGNAGPAKNLERWLHQRDRPGFQTQPAVRVPHALKKWWLADPQKPYDHVARRGRRIGFAVDDRFLKGGPHRACIKVTYLDTGTGRWALVAAGAGGEARREVACGDTGKLRTATFFLDDALFPASGMEFDFHVEAPEEATVSFVRVIRLGRGEPERPASPATRR